jgi:hypothetical protein
MAKNVQKVFALPKGGLESLPHSLVTLFALLVLSSEIPEAIQG